MLLRIVKGLATLPLLLVVARDALEQSPDLRVWATHALVKIHPSDPPPDAPILGARISAARNEFEPFQIVLRSETADLDGVDVEATDLTGPRESMLSRNLLTIYFERFMNLKTPSSIEGGVGEWPDPLIPKIDRYTGEVRNAFPFRLLRGRNQPLWIEVFVPLGTAPGTYSGVINITANGTSIGVVPISLKVWNFDLPSTSSLQTAFGFSSVPALKQHLGSYTSDEDLRKLTRVYARAALLHRISLIQGITPPNFQETTEGLVIDWRDYDGEVGSFLDGTELSLNDPLPGAKATSIDLGTHSALDTDEKKVLYWKEWVRHFKERGWLDRLFFYVWDEPSLEDIPKVAARAQLARSASPELRTLVTTQWTQALSGLIDIWTPTVNCFDVKPGFPSFCGTTVVPDAYGPEIAKGRSLWWYQACGSHGCNIVGGEYFTGWPSYMIDISAVANRIMEWLTWKYRIRGELYFNTVEAYTRDIDPWEDVYLFGGNGDGTLFYPGRPQQIGGTSHIPIESIRLKLIREGLEDYEYLTLLAARGLSTFADEKLGKLVKASYSWEHSPELLYSLREEMGEKLNGRGGPGRDRDFNDRIKERTGTTTP